MKIFISGPMSGYKNFNREAFYEAEKLLKEAGFDVFNPAWMDVGREVDGIFSSDFSSRELLSIDICALGHCDAIYQLDGWFLSSGAKLEWDFAKKCDIPRLVKVIPTDEPINVIEVSNNKIFVPKDIMIGEFYDKMDNMTFGVAKRQSAYAERYWDMYQPWDKIPANGEWIVVYEKKEDVLDDSDN
jgi:hypothetical protein